MSIIESKFKANLGVVYKDLEVMFGIGFVGLYKLCLALDLSGCPSVQVMFGMGFVCLSVCTSYVWHGGLSVCPSVQVMFGMGFVCSKHSSLIVFVIVGSPEKDSLLVLKRTGY